MTKGEPFLTFWLARQRFALRASAVDEVLPAAALGPLPHAPGVVVGTLVFAGNLLPVFDVRDSLALPVRPVRLSDHFIVARAGARRVVLVTEGADALIRVPAQALTPARALSERGALGAHVARLDDGTCAILELDAFLSAAEQLELTRLLELAAANAIASREDVSPNGEGEVTG